MADTDNASEITDALEKKITELQAELKHITNSLADNGIDLLEDAKDGAGKAVKAVKRQAADAADHAKSEVAAVVETAKENPTITATVITAVALAGFALGLVFASSTDNHRRW